MRSIEIALANRANDVCCLCSEAEADVGVLFVDSYSVDAWRKIHSKLIFPTILISSRALPGEKLVIEKPVKYTALLNLILEVAGNLSVKNIMQPEGNTAELIKEKAAESTGKEASGKISEAQKMHVLEEAVIQTAADVVKQVKKDTKVKRVADKPASKSRAGKASRLRKIKPDNVVQIINKRAHFEPSSYIVGYLADVIAGKNSSDVQLFEWRDMWLLVDERRKTIKANVNRRLLPHLTVMPMNEIPKRVISESEHGKLVLKEKLSLSIEDLLWLIIPLVGGQALPDGLPRDRKFILNTWPNFTQHNSASEFLPVASYWAAQPASVNDLAKRFDLSVKVLAAFVTSCYLCGFLDADKNDGKDDLPLEKPNKNAGMKKIFGKILTKLRHTG